MEGLEAWMSGNTKAQEAEGRKAAEAFERGEWKEEPPDLVDESGRLRDDLTPWERGWIK
jgi:hypothetical protein